jgi:hypothetical protein
VIVASRSSTWGERNSSRPPSIARWSSSGVRISASWGQSGTVRAEPFVLSRWPSWNSFGRKVTVRRSVLTSWSRSPSTSLARPPAQASNHGLSFGQGN